MSYKKCERVLAIAGVHQKNRGKRRADEECPRLSQRQTKLDGILIEKTAANAK